VDKTISRYRASCSGRRDTTSSSDGGDRRLLYRMCVRLNEGMTGKVILDDFADREPDYWIMDMAPNGSFIKIAEVLNLDLDQRVSLLNPETWGKKIRKSWIGRSQYNTALVCFYLLI